MTASTPFHINWLVERLHTEAVRRALAAYAKGRLLLDVGCGRRPFSRLLEAHSQRAFGIEVDRRRYGRVAEAVDARQGAKHGTRHGAVQSARRDDGQGAFPGPDAWANALQLPFVNECFDTVVSFQVLEHVPEPAQMMAQMARVLRPGGTLILTAPHIWGIHEEPHDYYRFTPFGLRHLAEVAGLQVQQILPLAGFWVTSGARFCHYLQHFEKIGLYPLTRPLMAITQVSCWLLDRLHPIHSDAWNHILVARRQQAPRPGAQLPGSRGEA